MNERIRDLAFECARQLNWNPPSDPKEYTFSSAGLEKFAELIVREICDIVEEDGSAVLPLVIKRRFGVEE